MPSFSARSEERLSTCDERLQLIFTEVIKTYDCTIVWGYRNAQDQNAAYNSGNSKVEWPNSKHNEYPSMAIDVVPYPTMWDSDRQLYHFSGYVLAVAMKMGYDLRWGEDWDGDNNLSDQTFIDLGHFELVDIT